jgi:phenylpyruvate tautomerase PptA (4-oxalocrotonate tautomerase family)
MPSLNIDIDIDDILWDLSDREKQELVDELYDDGYVPKQISGGVSEEEKNVLDLEWDELVKKISKLRLQITNEDEETIRKILNKY